MSAKIELQLLHAQRKELCEQLSAATIENQRLVEQNSMLLEDNKKLRNGGEEQPPVKKYRAMKAELAETRDKLGKCLTELDAPKRSMRQFLLLKGILSVHLKKQNMKEKLARWRVAMWRGYTQREWAMNEILVQSIREDGVGELGEGPMGAGRSMRTGSTMSGHRGIDGESPVEREKRKEHEREAMIAQLKKEIGIEEGYSSQPPLNININLSKGFDEVDLNGDGYISRQEFESMLKAQRETFSTPPPMYLNVPNLPIPICKSAPFPPAVQPATMMPSFEDRSPDPNTNPS